MTELAFALDVGSLSEAMTWVDRLEDTVDVFKVGLELFTAAGRWPSTTRPVILDLKLHDIPVTVEKAVSAAATRGARYLTLHVQQRETLERAVVVAAREGITLLGVTVLTSIGWRDMAELHLSGDPSQRVSDLVAFGHDAGLRGFVCSPHEVRELRASYPEATLLVPGVRPLGERLHDQKRVGTPEDVAADGASIAVVGRPIREAVDPAAMARSIRETLSRRRPT